MGVEVAGEIADPPGQQSDLNLGGSGIAFLALIFFDDFFLDFAGDQLAYPFFSEYFQAGAEAFRTVCTSDRNCAPTTMRLFTIALVRCDCFSRHPVSNKTRIDHGVVSRGK